MELISGIHLSSLHCLFSIAFLLMEIMLSFYSMAFLKTPPDRKIIDDRLSESPSSKDLSRKRMRSDDDRGLGLKTGIFRRSVPVSKGRGVLDLTFSCNSAYVQT